MRVTVFGSGYVGLVAAACFAQTGNEVLCMDVDETKINALKQGIVPIYEPGLEALVHLGQQSQLLRFTTNVLEAVVHGECLFIAVGTPSDETGKADLKYVTAVAEAIGKHIENYTIIINKSTVPIGTADKVKMIIHQQLILRQKNIPFDVVSNPEFLKQGAAIQDFKNPYRIILGVDNPTVEEKLRHLYAPFCFNKACLLVMDVRSAELTKYASNAMLATKISFMNEMANLAERVGADIEQVRIGMGSDPRIGHHFTLPGCGYGGSCFGKDIQALIHTAQEHQSNYDIIASVEKVNKRQKLHLFNKILAHYHGILLGKIFAIWGLSFKPNTCDMRDAPSVAMIHALIEAGAKVQVYDPKAMEEAKKHFKQYQNITYCASSEDALMHAHSLVILTEWPLFKNSNFNLIQERLQDSVIFDGRNIFDPIQLKEKGIIYYGIGRGQPILNLLPNKQEKNLLSKAAVEELI